MIEIADQLKAIHRSVRRDEEHVGLFIERTYDADATDVWEALTDPERLKRWFLPVSGDLKVGGRFQLENHAGGEILECEPPRRLRVTFGGDDSFVELRLTEADGRTTFTLDHTVPLSTAQNGAGALYPGPGWDGIFLGLDMFLKGETIEDPIALANSTEGQRFTLGAIEAWAAAVAESGTATAEELAATVEVARGHYAPDVS
ncbi:SRPBCC family protein [Actinosynnema sp. NPDC020468]|uniref:SRPBCC family protein n=1 Tax=Actinosynnema sp. NPDC020468 TaxID=3154488 RepID=UPI0033E9F679